LQKKRCYAGIQGIRSAKTNLNNIQIFNTDGGIEFKNQLLDDTLKTFKIAHSLSMKGSPYDYAEAEATFNH
jgi:putative transposase